MSVIRQTSLLLRPMARVFKNSSSSSNFDVSFSRLNISKASFSTTQVKNDVMEFFDDSKNWGQSEVKHGRAWTKDDLRIKSNTDLHKLWYVLLKERNMLLTMEHEYNDKGFYFPSPERLDKVKIGMKNLEEVIKERNKAYFELETGEPGVRIDEEVNNTLGMKVDYLPTEHTIPKSENNEWRRSRRYGGYAVAKFLRLYHEREYNKKRKEKNRNRNHVTHLLRRFPDIDINLLRERYPDVDIDKILRDDKVRPHI